MAKINKTSLSDTPFSESINDFGTERYVNGLVRFIENSSAPITIALQGEWGSGKTSMMTRLETALCSRNNAPFIGVKINTWEYSMMSSPEFTVYKILSQLVSELTGSSNDSKKKLYKLVRGLFRGGREALKQIPIPGIGVAVEMANMSTDWPMDENEISLSELRKELHEAVKKRLKNNDKRGVIVFVDDLDRLNPPVAVEILELLKNVFTLDSCIFVLAIDYDVVVKGLEPKFGKLTDKNEREFRSFFDKIIQVPFTLPVSSYRPMDFVLNALVDIGFLKDIDTSDPNVRARFSTVVESSVGKNPRSIKRLINTLSLLDCIAQCGTDSDSNEVTSMDEKLLNFIIVALQICYPQIYRMLVHKPAFTSWDNAFAHKEGIIENSNNQESNEWEDILEVACSSDKYLTQHLADITNLFSMIIDILGRHDITSSESVGMKLKQILDKSSVTGVDTNINAEEFDKKDFISKLHGNVIERLRQLRPDINRYKFKRITGNGGIYLWFDDNTRLGVTFTPGINSNNEIELAIMMDLHVARPERMNGMSFDELLQDEQLSSSLEALDSVLTPLLKSSWYLKGCKYDGQASHFTSFIDELRYIHEKGWMSGVIMNNTQYWIDLKKPSHFEDGKIVDTIAKMLIANFDFRKSLKNFK